ncbi:MAG: RdgB/HAM1 family non-canonical purine NTP pyrophosphatase [Myxococcota bacterium]|nr:RdgB/HAM1 family non-canonical purine NTP pyrophosphatase [Myxococcota bacterium]MDW8363351.1 RdgB/HAM1 family non-canonical purine NTP pyrophosphatase [Myxococcales bacterium]
MDRTVFLATSNAGKLAEIRALLGGLRGWRLEAFPEPRLLDLVEEHRDSFEGNATLKARIASAVLGGATVLADDSGLVVDALDGAPGVRSARWGGQPRDDARNRAALLDALAGVPEARRGARFVCVLAWIDPRGPHGPRPWVARGVLEGRIAVRERGSGGFGYDPLFELSDGRTLAELSRAEKNSLSHRARAAAALLVALGRHRPGRAELC